MVHLGIVASNYGDRVVLGRLKVVFPCLFYPSSPLSIVGTNKGIHLVVIHRDKKSKDDFSGIVNIFMTKKYGRSKILFGNFKLNTV